MTERGYSEYLVLSMENNSKFYKVRFFGSRSRKGQLTQVKEIIQVRSTMSVEDALRCGGWEVIHNLKFRELPDEARD